ncbi:hypothetical protein INR49_000882 [Caranx melampygus]|nr:hypothetical protein INR49_000882 [Caranx melampygus]
MGAMQTRSESKYKDLMEKTGFSEEQIKNLHIRFQQLSENEETIRNQHENEVGSFEEIGFEQFLMVMSHFRPPTLKTTEEEKEVMRKEKLRFLFNMHDTDNDGTITLAEYRKILKGLEMETRMHIRFLDVDTTTMRCGKSTS